jgi:hypothetical protein
MLFSVSVLAGACGCAAIPFKNQGVTISDGSARSERIASNGDPDLARTVLFDPPPMPAEGDATPIPTMCLEPSDQMAPTAKWESPVGSGLPSNIASDHRNFYSRDSVLMLGGGFLAGGVVANTSLDGAIQRHLQASILGAESDEWYHTFHASKEIGNGLYTLPLFATAWLSTKLLPDSEIASRVGCWGERSLRGFAVGAPPVIGLQILTGGSRPGESIGGSNWKPFEDNNGVSGHSFMGALPFITAAKLSENRTEKVVWYSASLLAPLSRVNDDDHYPSQVALGWWMAYLAASAVDSTHGVKHPWSLSPYVTDEATGIVGELRY